MSGQSSQEQEDVTNDKDVSNDDCDAPESLSVMGLTGGGAFRTDPVFLSGSETLCQGGLQDSSVSPSPLGTYWVSELIGTWLGLGLWGLGQDLTLCTFNMYIFHISIIHSL